MPAAPEAAAAPGGGGGEAEASAERRWWGRVAGRLDRAGQAFAAQVRERLPLGRGLDDEFYDALTDVLIASDCGVAVAEGLVEGLRRRARAQGLRHAGDAVAALQTEKAQALAARPRALRLLGAPAVCLVVGVNGVGKTTTVGKLAHRLRQDGHRPLIAAADTYRAAAVEQLRVWAERAGVEVVAHRSGADPGAVVFDAISAARARDRDVVLVDTAGRLHTRQNLMAELGKLVRVVARQVEGGPHEVLLVLDATTGGNALSQARVFQEVAAVTGLVLTKLDGSARGGGLLQIEAALDLPVKLVGVGEGLDDLGAFDPEAFLAALFRGVGDAATA